MAQLVLYTIYLSLGRHGEPTQTIRYRILSRENTSNHYISWRSRIGVVSAVYDPVYRTVKSSEFDHANLGRGTAQDEKQNGPP